MKKGFTLIELLAVIIILGIIATIAIVEVTGYIEHTHVQTAQTGALNVLKGAQGYYADNMTDNGHFEPIQLNILDSKDLLGLSGGLPDSGYVAIDSDSTTTVYYVRYNRCIIVNSNDVDIYMTENLKECGTAALITPDYVMKETTFDGIDDWYDSGYSLFDEDQNFTIITSFKYVGVTANIKNPSTLFHCMEEVSPYSGIGLDYMYAKGRLALSTTVKDIFSNAIIDEKQIIAIKRDSISNKLLYYVYDASGIIKSKNVISKAVLTPFENTLIIGAYQDITGQKGKFFKGIIYNFSLYMQALDDEIIKEKMDTIK